MPIVNDRLRLGRQAPGSGVIARCMLLLAAATAVAAAGVLLVPVAASSPEPLTLATSQHDDPGRLLYLRDCAWCHGAQADGTQWGPTLEGGGEAHTHYMISTGRMPIDNVDDPVKPSDAVYSPQEIRALAAHVGTLVEGPTVPDVDPDAGDLSLGGDLYRIHCAACHGATGIGTAMVSGVTAPHVWDSSVDEIAVAMLVGPGSMPVLWPPLDDHEVDSIAAYVLYLGEPDTRGGLAMLLMGPVAEGAIAVFVGLALLGLVCRWIGSSAGRL